MIFLEGFKHGFKEFGENLSSLVNSILLLIVYFFGVGLSSVIGKLAKKEFLIKDKKSKKTYWKNLNLEKRPIEEYYKQF